VLDKGTRKKRFLYESASGSYNISAAQIAVDKGAPDRHTLLHGLIPPPHATALLDPSYFLFRRSSQTILDTRKIWLKFAQRCRSLPE